MRLPALLPLFACLALIAADEPKTAEAPKADSPVAKPAEKAAPKAKKYMETPEIPEGISIEDGVKLQNAWIKAQADDTYKAAVAKAKEGDAKPKDAEGKKTKKNAAATPRGERAALAEALAKAMIKADPSLKPELVRTYLESSRRKGSEVTKKKDK